MKALIQMSSRQPVRMHVLEPKQLARWLASCHGLALQVVVLHGASDRDIETVVATCNGMLAQHHPEAFTSTWNDVVAHSKEEHSKSWDEVREVSRWAVLAVENGHLTFIGDVEAGVENALEKAAVIAAGVV